ncbi:MAG: nucleoside recognition protein [Lachnospiraceae bacterium]|nr:nucleoside recognition protein [Lachnospiraceae bacterium]
MLNYIWGFMIIFGIIYGAFNGTLSDVTNAVLDSSKEAVSLCITMVGIMSFWVGIMEIAKDAGIIRGATKKLEPFIQFLFPNIPQNHPAAEHISMNMIANILGLGWAATPAGLKAMESLAKLEEDRELQNDYQNIHKPQNRKSVHRNSGKEVASDEMCTFLIINISSLQLIPVNIIAYRSQYGSVNPTAVIGPGLVATMVSTGVAVIFCKLMSKKRREIH